MGLLEIWSCNTVRFHLGHSWPLGCISYETSKGINSAVACQPPIGPGTVTCSLCAFIVCLDSLLSKPTLGLQSKEVLLRTLTWHDWGQSRATWPEVIRWSWPLPRSLPVILMCIISLPWQSWTKKPEDIYESASITTTHGPLESCQLLHWLVPTDHTTFPAGEQ